MPSREVHVPDEARRAAGVIACWRLPVYGVAFTSWYCSFSASWRDWRPVVVLAAWLAITMLEASAVASPVRTVTRSQRVAFAVVIALTALLCARPVGDQVADWLRPWREGDSIIYGFGATQRLWEFSAPEAAIAFGVGAVVACVVPVRVACAIQPPWAFLVTSVWMLVSFS